MTKELEEAKARLSAVLRDHERNPQAGTLYLLAADLRTLLSALSRGDGWVLVPKEPTPEMFKAGDDKGIYASVRVIYQAMIAAAPPVPEGEE